MERPGPAGIASWVVAFPPDWRRPARPRRFPHSPAGGVALLGPAAPRGIAQRQAVVLTTGDGPARPRPTLPMCRRGRCFCLRKCLATVRKWIIVRTVDQGGALISWVNDISNWYRQPL